MVLVARRMYCFQASEPDSRPPPVSFSPPNAPPISAPEVPMLTLAMPQSEPVAERNCSASRRFMVKMDEERPWGTSLWRASASAKVAVPQDVEDGREGLAFDDVGLSGDFDECGADVEGLRGFRLRDALAAGDGGACGACVGQGLLHGEEGALVDERADEGAGFARVADDDGGVDLLELGDEIVVDGVVDDEAAQGRAALAGSAHGGEGDGAEGEVEVGGGGRRWRRCCRRVRGWRGQSGWRGAELRRGPWRWSRWRRPEG